MNKKSSLEKNKKNISRLASGLKNYYTEPMTQTFRRFRSGLIYFGVGLGTILMANEYMTPSLSRDLVFLFGLILLAIGFFIAMLAHTRLIISRIVIFFQKK